MATQASLFSVPAAAQPEAAVLIEAQEPRPRMALVVARRSAFRSRIPASTWPERRSASSAPLEDGQYTPSFDFPHRGGRGQRSSARVEAPGRFGRAQSHRQIRQRDPPVSLQHLPPFEIGIHLLPLAALEQVEQRLRQFAVDRAELVKAFLAVYPSLCVDAAKRLRALYNPTDYPSGEDVAREFEFSWQYVSFGVPDQLKGISQEVWEQEREKAAQRMAEASSEIQQVLRETMAKLIQHMADRLKTGAMTS